MKRTLIILISLAIANVLSAQSVALSPHSGVSFVDNIARSMLWDSIGRFNVKSYGAVGDSATDDTEAIQAAIDAAILYTNGWEESNFPPQGQGAIVYVPSGIYRTTGELVIANVNELVFKGDGSTSRIRATGAGESIIVLRDGIGIEVRDILLEGNGTSYHGSGATTLYGIESDHGMRYATIDNVVVLNTGNHGLYLYNGNWGNVINNCKFTNNAGDGINIVSNSGQENTGENSNATTITGTELSANNGDGLEFAGSGLSFTNQNTVENNNGSGVQLGSSAGDYNTVGVIVSGNWFEGNDSAQIKLFAVQSPETLLRNIVIDNNWMLGNNTIGDPYIIYQSEVGSTTYSLHQSYIGRNEYNTSGGFVDTLVYLKDARDNTKVYYGSYTQNDIVLGGGAGTVEYKGVANGTPVIKAVSTSGLAVSDLRPLTRIYGTGWVPIDITTNPQIAAGWYDGQVIRFIGRSESAPVTFDDGAGLQLTGSFTMGVGDVLELMWDEVQDLWVEVLRSDN